LSIQNKELIIKENIKIIQSASADKNLKKIAIENVLEIMRPLRLSLLNKFVNKGVESDDLLQQIDLIMIESLYDYDETKDKSALRHIVYRAKNGIWNYYRKEMNYFDDKKKTLSINFAEYDKSDDKVYKLDKNLSVPFNEDMVIDKIMIDEELSKLTPHQKEILLLHFINDMKQNDIAEVLNIHQSNVSRAKKRAIKSFRNNTTLLDEQDDID